MQEGGCYWVAAVVSRVPGHCTGRLEQQRAFKGRSCFVLANFGSADAVGGGDGLLFDADYDEVLTADDRAIAFCPAVAG